jgi:hypothetical protein
MQDTAAHSSFFRSRNFRWLTLSLSFAAANPWTLHYARLRSHSNARARQPQCGGMVSSRNRNVGERRAIAHGSDKKDERYHKLEAFRVPGR